MDNTSSGAAPAQVENMMRMAHHVAAYAACQKPKTTRRERESYFAWCFWGHVWGFLWPTDVGSSLAALVSQG